MRDNVVPGLLPAAAASSIATVSVQTVIVAYPLASEAPQRVFEAAKVRNFVIVSVLDTAAQRSTRGHVIASQSKGVALGLPAASETVTVSREASAMSVPSVSRVVSMTRAAQKGCSAKGSAAHRHAPVLRTAPSRMQYARKGAVRFRAAARAARTVSKRRLIVTLMRSAVSPVVRSTVTVLMRLKSVLPGAVDPGDARVTTSALSVKSVIS